jgi:hypothetical protein
MSLARAGGIAISLAISVGPVIGAMLLAGGREPYEHVGWGLRAAASLPLALGLALGLGAAARRLLPDDAAQAQALMFIWLYSLPAAYLLLGALNVSLDRGGGELRAAELVEIERRHKGGDRAVLRWLDGEGGLVRLVRGFAPEKVGDRACFRVYRGALGLAWLQPAAGCEGEARGR